MNRRRRSLRNQTQNKPRRREATKKTQYLALQKYCSNFQDPDDIEVTKIEQRIVTLQEKIKTTYLNKVKELAEERVDSLLTRDLEQRKLLDKYFELLTKAIKSSMEEMDLICNITPNDPYNTKRRKITITSSD